MVDREQIFQSVGHWYPIFAAFLSSFLNFVSFMIGLEWDTRALSSLSLMALLSSMVFSALVVGLLYKVSSSSHSQEFTILESHDEYDISDRRDAIYRRTVKLKVKKDLTCFVSYPAEVDGEQRNFRAYQADSPNVEYGLSMQRVGGRRASFIYLGRPLQKGDIIEGLCVECHVLNSFEDEHEGVSVRTYPGQKRCSIRVLLPEGYPPIPPKADWCVLHGPNRISPLHNGSVDAYQSRDGKHVIAHDFSSLLSPMIGLQCAISWKWKPTVACEE